MLKLISVLLCSSFLTQFAVSSTGDEGLRHSSATTTHATRPPTNEMINMNLGGAGVMSHIMKYVAPIIKKIGVNTTTNDEESSHHGETISLRRHLDTGDFEELNEILQGAMISIPDQTVNANVLFTLTLDLKNLKCFAFSVGDIVINYILDVNDSNQQRLKMTLDIIELDLTCSLDYDYRYSFFSGRGDADAFTDNNSVRLYFNFESPDFSSRPPTDFNLKSCGNDPEDSRVFIDVTNIDFRGGFVGAILETFDDLIANAIEDNVKDIGCSAIVESVAPLGIELIDTANGLINPYLEGLSAEYADPLYPEKTLVVPETMDLLNLGDLENELGSLVRIIIDALRDFLDIGEKGSSTTTNTTNTTISTDDEELKINEIIRDNLLEEDRTLSVNVSNLEFAPDGVIFESKDELTDTTITLEGIKIYGLDTFTTFEPLVDIGRYTLQSNVGLSYLEIEAALVIDIRPSTGPDSLFDTPGSERVVEEITIRAGVEDVAATLSAFLALDQDKLESLTLGNLLDVDRLTGCLLSTVIGAEITGLNVTVGNFRQPVTAGFISVGIDRILSNLVDSLFIMYEAVILKALPNVFQTLVRDTINDDAIASLFSDPDKTVCLKRTKAPSSQPSFLLSDIPSSSPTGSPSNIPSSSPTGSPSNIPSSSPIGSPSNIPSSSPTGSPSNIPSSSPIESLSNIPLSSSLGPSSIILSSSPSSSPSKVSALPSPLLSTSPIIVPSISSSVPSSSPSKTSIVLPSPPLVNTSILSDEQSIPFDSSPSNSPPSYLPPSSFIWLDFFNITKPPAVSPVVETPSSKSIPSLRRRSVP